ncbi:MAG TPA: aldo/keto reductase, partial [Thermoanaerobaculia bacterium]|nr:aldo/keto reductase [Thermoanaerobaculia bacterium]
VNGRPERMREGLEGSLRRLKVERIDLYQLHRIDAAVPEEEQFGFLREAQTAGRIRHIGLSEVTVEDIDRARRHITVTTVQNRYNLGDREWESVVDYCERENIGFIPWYPLAVGKLAQGDGPLARIADAHGAKPAQIALAWLLRRSPVMLPIPGTSRVKHLEENMTAATITLTDDEFEEISKGA